jgi:RNA polymerase sigma-70 factor (ECF subfamily)
MDESAIIKRCLDGDSACFQQIVNNHTPHLMAAALTVLGNRQDAEDICQETFLQAYHHLSSFDGDRNLRAWLYTILYRRCLNAVKKKKKFTGVLGRLKTESMPWTFSEDSRLGDWEGIPAELYETLSPKERTVLSLWINEGYKAVEIASILGCPSGTARYYLFTVRKKIKAILEKTHESLPKH